MTQHYYLCAHEQFSPSDLLKHAAAAAAGFDGIGCSDHLQPWLEAIDVYRESVLPAVRGARVG